MGSGLSRSRELTAETGALRAQALSLPSCIFCFFHLSPQKSPKLKTLCTPYSPEHPHSILLVVMPKMHFAMTLGLPDGQSYHYEYSPKTGGDDYFIRPDTQSVSIITGWATRFQHVNSAQGSFLLQGAHEQLCLGSTTRCWKMHSASSPEQPTD